MGLVKLSMQEKHDETLCGGRHNLYQEFLENIFQKLKSCADLVFFQGMFNVLKAFTLKNSTNF